jgi:hypothetical protein
MRLKSLEEFLRPTNLLDKVRGVALGAKGGRTIDLDDLDEVEGNDYAGAMERATATIVALGRDVAVDDEALTILLPDLLGGDHKVIPFGRGLALGADNPRQMWRSIVAQVESTDEPQVGLLGGFLQGLQTSESALADVLLDEAVEDAALAKWFPILQTFATIDAKATVRLHRALELGRAPITAFRYLAMGRASDTIPGPELKQLLFAISAQPGGNPVAIDILSMRIHSDRSDKTELMPEVCEIGRALLTSYAFPAGSCGQRAQREDYELSVIARASLGGDCGKRITRQLCRGLLVAVEGHSVSAFEYSDLITGLLKIHPDDVLDELLSGGERARSRSVAFIADLARHHKSPMYAVPDAALLGWCDLDPQARYPFAAAIVPLFDESGDEVPSQWKEISRALLLKAPNKADVFREIVSRLYPTGGIGSLSSQYESRLKLLN